MDLDALCNTLGVEIDRNLLQQALTHRSYAYEHGGIPNSERLELLGDSVLGFVVTEHIYQTLPTLDEGELTKVKNSVVSEKALAFAARQIGLGDHLLLGKGEINTGGRDKPSLLCDVFEAVLGAIYLTAGMPAAKTMVEKFIFPLLADPDALRQQSDPKTRIIEVAQAKKLGDVNYEITHEGPDHDRVFFAKLSIGGNLVCEATGKTKKAAEMEAAVIGLEQIEAGKVAKAKKPAKA
jgi:ribonuclease-3